MVRLIVRREYEIACCSVENYIAKRSSSKRDNTVCSELHNMDMLGNVHWAGRDRLALYKKWLEAGYRCFGLIESAKLVSYLWFSLTDATDQGDSLFRFTVPVREGEAYLFDFSTDPSKQNSGRMTRLMDALFDKMYRERISRVKWIYDERNIAARHLVERFATHSLGSVRLTYVLGRRFINLSNLSR